MQRTAVNSSTVVSVGWEDGTLELEFASGGIYRYEHVPKETFEGFMRAESKGHFFQVGIRPCYECVRLHVKDCYEGSLYRETVGDKCPDTCLCWCHKERKDVTRAKDQKKADAPAKKGKAKRPPV